MRPLSLLSLVRLFARGVRAGPWTRLSDRAKVGGLAATSIATSELPWLALVGDIIFLALVFYATYLLAKPVVSKLFADLADDTGLRLILSLPAVAVVHAVSWNTTNFATVHRPTIAVVAVGTPILLDAYLSRTDTPRAYPFAYGRELSRFIGESQERIAADLQRIEIVTKNSVVPFKTLIAYEMRVAIPLVLFLPFLGWGILVALLEGFYPALELVLLVGAALGPAIARRSPRFDDGAEVLAAIDTEEQSSRALLTKDAFHPKWLTSVMFIVTNLMIPLTLFLAGIVGIFSFIEHAPIAQRPSPESVLSIVTFGAIVSTFFIFSLYALWFWRVELARIPAFLSHWRDIYIKSETDSPAATEPPAKTRPPWGLLPPAAIFLVTMLFVLVLVEVQSNPTAIWLAKVAYVVLWALGVLFVGWAVVQWYHRDPQPIRNESRVLVGNCIVQVIPLFGLFLVAREFADPPFGQLVAVPVSWIVGFYAIDAFWIFKNKYGEGSLLIWTPLLGCLAGMFVLRHYFGVESIQILIYGTAAFILLVGTLLKAQLWLANKHAPREDFQLDDAYASTERDDRPTSE